MNNKTKQDDFMLRYEVIHVGFVKYCKAKSYGIMEYKDLVNETIARAFESYDKLKNKEVFAAYLYGITKNIIKNELRKQTSINKYEVYRIDRNLTIENHAEQKFEIEILYKALAHLSENQKEAIILFEISGYSIKDIAIIQDARESTVKQRLKRGREKLLEILSISESGNEKTKQNSVVLRGLFF